MSPALVVEPSNESCRCSVRPAVSSTITHSKYVVDKAPICTRPRRRQQPSLKIYSVCLLLLLLLSLSLSYWGQDFRDRAVKPLYVTDLYHAKWPTLVWLDMQPRRANLKKVKQNLLVFNGLETMTVALSTIKKISNHDYFIYKPLIKFFSIL